MTRRYLALVLGLLLTGNAAAQWQVDGEVRARFEALDGEFRLGLGGSDQALNLRTNLRATYRGERWEAGGELMDARVQREARDAFIANGQVSAADVLQAWVGYRWETGSAEHRLRAGRLTLDLSTRRLVARNRYRNTINAFTGVHWAGNFDRTTVQAFWFLPVIRLPLLPRDNDHAWDRQRSDIRFAGVHLEHRLAQGRVEAFAYDLDESDVPELPTRDRDILTVGGRFASGRSAGAFDFEAELAWQTGTARSSVLSSRDLDHEAGFAHLEIGYSFEQGWLDRLAFQYDYADGDDDPLDNESNRFFTLFGARRFDFGPTGIYGPFARSNISSPGLRATFSPAENVGGMVALRDYRLASATDSWTTSGLRDITGNSGKDLGTQIELRLRWDPNETWRVEFGAAYLDQGSFPRNRGSRAGDSRYAYIQTRWAF